MKRTSSLKNKICQNSQEKIDNLNRPVCIKEIESISSLPNQKASGPDELNGEFCQTLKDKIMSLFTENGSGGTAPWLVWVQRCPDTRSRRRQCKKTTDQNHSWTQRIPQQNISKSNSTVYEENYTSQPNGFIPSMQGWFNIQQSINLIYQINRLKKENDILVEAKRAFDRI